MFCSNCGTKLAADAAFCSGCGSKVAVSVSSPIAPQPDINKQHSPKIASNDFGRALLQGDGTGNAAITVTILTHLIIQAGLSLFIIYVSDGGWLIFGILLLLNDVIILVNTYVAAKATEIIVYEHGVKGVSLDSPGILTYMFWTMYKTTEFKLTYAQISSVNKDTGKFVEIKDQWGRSYKCPAQNSTIIYDTILKNMHNGGK